MTFSEWVSARDIVDLIDSERTLQVAHLAWAAATRAERAACAQIALAYETEGQPELFGDPDMPTPITRFIIARGP